MSFTHRPLARFFLSLLFAFTMSYMVWMAITLAVMSTPATKLPAVSIAVLLIIAALIFTWIHLKWVLGYYLFAKLHRLLGARLGDADLIVISGGGTVSIAIMRDSIFQDTYILSVNGVDYTIRPGEVSSTVSIDVTETVGDRGAKLDKKVVRFYVGDRNQLLRYFIGIIS